VCRNSSNDDQEEHGHTVHQKCVWMNTALNLIRMPFSKQQHTVLANKHSLFLVKSPYNVAMCVSNAALFTDSSTHGAEACDS